MYNIPKWAREIQRFLSVKPQFILAGNVYDVYPLDIAGNITTLKLTDFLEEILKQEGYSLIVSYEPLYGFSLEYGDADTFKKIAGETISPHRPLQATLFKAFEIIEKLAESTEAYSAVFIKFSSRFEDLCGKDTNEFFYRMYRHLHRISPKIIGESAPKFNFTVLIADKENDIPDWYSVNNPKIKVLSIAKPDYEIRRVVVEALARTIKGYNELDDEKKEECRTLFIDQTGELYASEIISIVALARREELSFDDIGEAIKRYKLGIIENPWAKIDLRKVTEAESVIGRRVKGQNHAIRKAADIIKRAVYNLSGSQYSKFSQKPKGVMFLAGPTGVGKTELAKTVTELIFGSETSYIRFDMSEFSQEHTDQRMIGAPPGYQGYDMGGELTNSVKQNPFSVVLFDEIEKAHPKIMDIFLQLLDDGRLTSGRGETVYFSECLIIFTSNLGIYDTDVRGNRVQRVNAEMDFNQIEKSITGAIDDYFKYELRRPEILNRIGDNIVVFDFIRKDIADDIFRKMMRNVVAKLADSFEISISFSKEAGRKIFELCTADLSMGGRGIGNKIEDIFVNPLSRALFEIQAKKGENLLISDIEKDGASWKIVLQKST